MLFPYNLIQFYNSYLYSVFDEYNRHDFDSDTMTFKSNFWKRHYS